MHGALRLFAHAGAKGYKLYFPRHESHGGVHIYLEFYGNPPPAYLLEVRGEQFELGGTTQFSSGLQS